MSKKTKEEVVDSLYSSDKKNNKNKSRNKNVPKKAVSKDNRINLDNEIIIGLTPKKKINDKKPEAKVKNTSKKSVNNRDVKNKENKTKNKRKSKKHRLLKWIVLIVLTVVIIVLFMMSPVFNIKKIEVEGVQKVSKDEIVELSQIKIDDNTFRIKSKNVINAIKNNTYVEKVEIKRDLPSVIKIIVKERTPKYIIETTAGNAYIDLNGYILEISTEMLELPILKGFETENDKIIDFQNTKKLDNTDCEKLKVINEILETATTNNVLNYINVIDISDNNDIKLILESENKIAHLGDGSNANLRILYMKKMIEEEVGKEGEIFINGDVTTLKPKPYFREKV